MSHLNTRDSYKIYTAGSNNPVSVKEFLDICYKFNTFVVGKILDGHTVTLPERLGRISVVGKKVNPTIGENGEIKGLAPDWVETKKLWERDPQAKENKQLVYHFNEHTNSVRYKFIWSKSRVLVQNKTVYSLKMTRTNKRELSSRIKEGKEYYIKS